MKSYIKKLNSADDITVRMYYKPKTTYPLRTYTDIMITDISELMTTGMVKYKCSMDGEEVSAHKDLLKLAIDGYAD